MSSQAMQDLERALSLAVKRFGNPTGLVNKNTHSKGYVKERQYVRLKVRRLGSGGVPYGNPFDFEYYSKEISELGAECEAKKEARKKGYCHWVTAENRRVEL